MEHFTPVSAAIGGVMIGTSAALLFLLDGRIAGISGILGGLTRGRRGDTGWRVAFLLGLMAAVPLHRLTTGEPMSITVATSPLLLIAAGVLVGFGTRLGGGCTSGHGVCGIARLSKRSLAATAAFMLVAVATVFIAREVGG
jgi:uncharacterized membrane protein YedE/YeeE